MRTGQVIALAGAAAVLACGVLTVAPPPASAQGQSGDPIKALVGRLDLERYKATIKGLAQFGDRRQGRTATVPRSNGSRVRSRAMAAPLSACTTSMTGRQNRRRRHGRRLDRA